MSNILSRRLARMAEIARGDMPVDITGWATALERASKVVAEHYHKWNLVVDETGETFYAECACGVRRDLAPEDSPEESEE
jgi:hypothetical protein